MDINVYKYETNFEDCIKSTIFPLRLNFRKVDRNQS